jgi:hypothetical protein
MRCSPVRYMPHEVHARRMHACEVRAHEVHAHGVQACEVHAYKV